MEQKKLHDPVGKAGSMPGTTGFTMACFEADKVKMGDSLYSESQYLEQYSIISELLDALTSILAMEGTEENEWDAVERVIPEICAKARSAIAKATGAKE